jgi:hypothetical protein
LIAAFFANQLRPSGSFPKTLLQFLHQRTEPKKKHFD